MHTFGETLKENIKKQGLTVYRIANDTGIDRSFLQGVLAGKRKLPQKRFTDIINPSFFTDNQINEMCNIYYTEKFGTDKMQRLNYIEYGLTGSIKKDLDFEYKTNPIELELNKFYDGKDKVLSVIAEILNSEEKVNFYSNFPFYLKEINKIIYNACKNGKFDDFFHCVFENDGTDCNNLETLFNSLHYAEKGFITYVSDKNFSSALFPFFILTDKYFLQFDKKSENAYLTNADENIKHFVTKRIEKIKSGSSRYVTITENAFEYMNTLDIALCADYHNIYGFDNTFCPMHITSEIIDEIATPAIKSIPNIAEQLSAHYSLILNNEKGNDVKELIITYEGLNNFIQSGKIECFPKTFAYPVPEKFRSDMLNALIDSDLTYQIVKPNFFNSTYKFNFEINNNKLVFASCDDIDDDETYVGKVLYLNNNELIVNDFSDFIDYYSNSGKSYSPTESKKFIQNSIIKLPK